MSANAPEHRQWIVHVITFAPYEDAKHAAKKVKDGVLLAVGICLAVAFLLVVVPLGFAGHALQSLERGVGSGFSGFICLVALAISAAVGLVIAGVLHVEAGWPKVVAIPLAIELTLWIFAGILHYLAGLDQHRQHIATDKGVIVAWVLLFVTVLGTAVAWVGAGLLAVRFAPRSWTGIGRTNPRGDTIEWYDSFAALLLSTSPGLLVVTWQIMRWLAGR